VLAENSNAERFPTKPEDFEGFLCLPSIHDLGFYGKASGHARHPRHESTMSISENSPHSITPSSLFPTVSGVTPSVPAEGMNSNGIGAVAPAFVDRRAAATDAGLAERRQFGSTHSDLSPEARELAVAIDRYKLEFRRRYITCEEMLAVVKKLGYHR